MIRVYVFVLSMEEIPQDMIDKWRQEFLIDLVPHDSDREANRLFSKKRPDVIITINRPCTDFPILCRLPLYLRQRWISVESVESINPEGIRNCFRHTVFHRLGPVVSVFTTTFRSGDKILRPFESLLHQTCTEWEWVIMDDSDDDGETFERLRFLQEQECRIRVFRSTHNNGYIGSVKRDVAMMGVGKYLVELDHDDELLPNALELVVRTFDSCPEAGMVSSDFTEVYEHTYENFLYGPYFGFNFGSYYRERWRNQWVNVARGLPLNQLTLRHIIGVPNHVRVWKASVYRELDGHNPHLFVADDYDLILRTFFSKYRIVHIPRLLYIQYRNQGGNNFTFIRNRYIQNMVCDISHYYDESIHQRLSELNIPDIPPGSQLMMMTSPPNPYLSHEIPPIEQASGLLIRDVDSTEDTVSIIMPTYNRPGDLRNAVASVLAQRHRRFVLYIIGDHCPKLDELMSSDTMFHDPRIRWWNLHENFKEGGTTARNYALKMLVTTDLVAYLDDDNTWDPDHLETLVPLLMENPAVSFAFSSFRSCGFTISCKRPVRYRIDTSCIIHRYSLLRKYGYWRSQSDVGYAHDWEIVERWVNNHEPWKASGFPTLQYNNCHQNMEHIYHAYDDQEPVQEEHKTDVLVNLAALSSS